MEETINYKGYRIRIFQDDYTESPNECDNSEIFLVYDHRDFTVEVKGFKPRDIFEHLSAKEPLKENYTDIDEYELDYNDYAESINLEYNKYWIFPVNVYIHSGVALSLGKEYPLNDRWDVSTTGYILVSKIQVLTEEFAKNLAESLIKEWNQYLCGDVWGYIIEKSKEYYTISKKELDDILTADDYNNDMIPLDSFIKISEIDHDWEEVDSCWGFYGQEYCINEAKLIVDSYEN